MDKQEYIKFVHEQYEEYMREKRRIDISNASVDSLVKEERNKEGVLGGNDILKDINDVINFLHSEFAKFDFNKIVNSCNALKDIKPIYIPDDIEDKSIFDDISNAASILDNFYKIMSSILNMITYLRNNSSLSDEQSHALSEKIGEAIYFNAHIEEHKDEIYNRASISIKKIIENNVYDIEEKKRNNKTYLESKKAIFKGEIEGLLEDFNFFYGTPSLSDLPLQNEFLMEYNFIPFLLDKNKDFKTMIDEINEVDIDLASSFKCHTIVRYDSTNPKSYVINGTDENNMNHILKNMMISFVNSYPLFYKHIALIDRGEDELINNFMNELSLKSSNKLLYKDFPSIINGDNIKPLLKSIKEHIDNVDKILLEDGFEDIFIYNASHKEEPLDIILLLINDFPCGFKDEEDIDLLIDILSKNNRTGVITLINYNKNFLEGEIKAFPPYKDLKGYNLKNMLPLDKGDFDEEEFFENIRLLNEYLD